MIIKGKRESLEKKAAWILAETIQQISDSQSHVVLAVPGGRSVVGVLDRLRFETVDWEKVHLFMVDERLVPLDHPESNFRLVSSRVSRFIRPTHLHPYVHDCEYAAMGAERYRQQLLEFGGRFDIVLLAAGEDGHVAGLFPNHETMMSSEDFFVLTERAPKPPAARMTSSRKLLGRARTALVLFFGPEKHAAFSAYIDEKVDPNRCPAKIAKSVADHFALTDWGI